MGLLLDSVLQANAKSRRGGECSVAALLASLDEDDRADLTAVMDNPDVPSTLIVREIKPFGLDVGVSTMQRHRRGDCLCGS